MIACRAISGMCMVLCGLIASGEVFLRLGRWVMRCRRHKHKPAEQGLRTAVGGLIDK